MSLTASSQFNKPFAEQLAFFRKKINVPSERWDDIWQQAHDRAFMVAGAQKADLLDDLRKAVDGAIAEGKSIGWFRKNFDAIVAKHGWTGWTGEGSKGGRDWRTRIIYQTNMSTSYSAGRWAQLSDPDLIKMRPYKRYVHADGVQHPRPLHQSWNGITLPHDDPFWDTHFAPNGWRCHCRITAASEQDYQVAKGTDKASRPTGWDTIDPKTGAPLGIDAGFGYAPGKSGDVPLREMVSNKLVTYPPAISKALSHDVNRYVAANYPPSEFADKVLADTSITYPLWLGFVENSDAIKSVVGADVAGYMGLLPAEAPRHILRTHGHDGSDQRPPVPADYNLAWEVLNTPDQLVKGNELGRHGESRIEAIKQIGNEIYHCVYQAQPGKRNRAMTLVTMYIKTVKK
jgi:hypothetical protein